MIHAEVENNFESWRIRARGLITQNVSPNEIVWSSETQSSLYPELSTNTSLKNDVRVPKAFVKLTETVACFDNAEKWPLLYRILFRLINENENLLYIESDSDVRAARVMEKAVNRDVHKFHAFVRFREIKTDGEEFFAAWHEPQHWCVKRATPFFARRFGAMKWSIFTPKGCAHWDKNELMFSEPATRSQAPVGDDMEDLWRLYYRSIFNPFRLNVKTMRREFPVRHWQTLPEAELIPDLVRLAQN